MLNSHQVNFGGLRGPVLPAMFLLIVPFIITAIVFWRANRFTINAAVAASILTILGSATVIAARIAALRNNRAIEPDWLEMSRVVLVLFLPTLVPFIIMLFQKWKGIHRAPAESQAGAAGLQAWLTPWRLIWVAMLAGGLFVWFEIPFLVSAAVLLGLLAAYPLLQGSPDTGETGHATVPAASSGPVDDLASEREKVLCMIADHSITAEEGAELLNALAATRRAPRKQAFTLARGQKLMLAGAVLVTVGFFLPWLTYNPGREASRLANQMGNQVSAQFGAMPGLETGNVRPPEMPLLDLQTQDVQVAGSEVRSALGWMILLLAVAATGLQFLTDVFSARTRRVLEMACLAGAGFLLIYIGSNGLRYLAFGFMVVLIGYICEVVGYVQNNRRFRASSMAVPTGALPTCEVSTAI